MEATLQLGAKLDIASGEELKELRDDIGGMFDKAVPVKPRYFSQSGSISGLTPPTTAFCRIGAPPTGSVWNITGWSAMGQDLAHGEIGGNISLFVGDMPLNGTEPMPSQLKATGISLPMAQSFGENVLWVAGGQTVFAALTAVTVITAFVVNIFVGEYHAADVVNRTGR